MKGLGLRSLGLNFAATFGRQVGAGLLALATTALIARIFGPSGNGTFAVLLLVPTTLSAFLSLGISAANVYLIGSGQTNAKDAVTANFRLGLLLSVVGSLVGALGILIKGQEAFPGVETKLLWLALPLFPLTLLFGFLTSILQALQEFRAFNRLLLLQPALLLVFVSLSAVSAFQSLGFLVVAQLVAQGACLLLTVISLNRVIADRSGALWESRLKPSSSFSRRAVSYGWKAHVAGILAFVNYKADIFLVNFFLTPVAAGIYVIAVSLAEKLWMISTAVSTVLLPRLSQLENSEGVRRQLTPIITRSVLLVTLVVALVLGLCAYPLVLAVFGRQYLGSLLPLYALLPGVVVIGGARVLANDLASRGRPELNMYIALLTVSVNVAGNIALIPTFGLLGAAVATTVAYLLCSACTLGVYLRISDNKWRDTVIFSKSDVILAIAALRR